MRRYLVLSVLVLLFLSPLALCQPELPDMGDDMFELEGAEGFGSSFGLYSPLLSSKQSAPVITKSAPIVAKAPRVTMRAVPYTYTKPVTHLESVAVPTKQIIDDEVLTFEQVPVQQGKKGYSGGYGGGGGYGGFGVAQGGYQGNGLWQGPGGLWPGVGFGTTGGFGWSPLGALSGFGSFGKLGWGGYKGSSPWLYGSWPGLAALAGGGGY